MLEVIRFEAPLHEDRLMEALEESFGYSSSSYVGPVRMLLDELAIDSIIDEHDDGFIALPNAEISVRYPADESFKRPIHWIPPDEIRTAIVSVVRDAVAVDQDELERVVRDVFGFKRLGPKIASALQEATRDLLKQSAISQDEAGRYRLA
jgi:hypothetical protein